MNIRKIARITTVLLASGTTTATAQIAITLGDPGVVDNHGSSAWITTGGIEVAWSVIGEINWAPDAYKGGTPWDTAMTTPEDINNDPLVLEPYGDILAYTGAGVGDVDGDGYGDYAVTWYDADLQLGADDDHSGACAPHPAHASEYVGLVRIMSGNPDYNGASTFQDTNTDNADGRISTWNRTSTGFDHNVRRIGHNFWGQRSGALWSHEINAIGDVDGDGRDDILLSANGKTSPSDPFGHYDGLVEIWSFTNEYNLDGSPHEHWVKLIEIKGAISTNPADSNLELGYQSHHGPVPRNAPPSGTSSDGFDLDFNNDGQQDLLLASKFYRTKADGSYVNPSSTGNYNDRSYAPGAAWIFLLPKSDVFYYVKNGLPGDDEECNASGLYTGTPDNISDLLPLKYSSDDFSVKIVGHQGYYNATNTAPTDPYTDYPRHFGYDIDPAGDVDGDGNLDLIVSAPHHKRNHDPSTGAYTYNQSDQLVDSKYEGATYLFLSNSGIDRDGSESYISFSELLPKYYYDDGILSFGKQLGVETLGDPYLSGSIKKRNMSLNQLAFKSDKADFVFAGHRDHGYSNGTAAVGGSIEAGINLNDNDDPDLVLLNNLSGRAEVILDLRSKIRDQFDDIMGNFQGPTTTMIEVWDSDHGTGASYHAPLHIAEIQHIDEEVGAFSISSNPINYSLTNFAQLGINGTTSYAAIGGFRIAGNHDGDANGDCELFLNTINNYYGFCGASNNCDEDPTAHRKGAVVVDIATTGSAISVLTEYWPEHTNLCTLKFDTLFNVNGIHTSSDNLSLWPVWNGDAATKDDAFVGARGYQRQALNYPESDPGLVHPGVTPPLWHPIQYPSVSNSCQLNSMSVVPAGKAYLVKSP